MNLIVAIGGLNLFPELPQLPNNIHNIKPIHIPLLTISIPIKLPKPLALLNNKSNAINTHFNSQVLT